MKIRYVGPHPEVLVPALGQWVKKGETIEVDIDLAKQLLEQPQWKRPPAKKKDD